MDMFDLTTVLVFLFFIGVVAIIAFTVYKIVKMICLTNAEVKAFGSSKEYTEFLKWRQEQGRQ